MGALKEKFDLVVIGAGPGGYVAAIKGAQKGKRVALIERELMGGTCLNVGCIPTKTLIANAHMMHTFESAADFGFKVGPISFDYSKMKSRKDSVVKEIRDSLTGLIKSKKITIFKGEGSFEASDSDAQLIKVVSGESRTLIETAKTIIATGSAPMEMAAFPTDASRKIYNSSTILEMTKLPKKLAVIGGGYIGCEFASLFAQLGVEVTILEFLPKIVMLQGEDISKALTDAFIEKGIEIRTKVKVTSIEDSKAGLKVNVEAGEACLADAVLVSVGRTKVTDGLNLRAIGLGTTRDGSIQVNEKMETAVPGVYAIGDVTGKGMLAHVASHQALVAASNAAGASKKMHYEAVPAVIFTSPEIATVGKMREELDRDNIAYKVGKFPFAVLGKSKAAGQTEGFAQVLIAPSTGKILGAQVVGSEAASLISEMALAITAELTAEDIAETIHAHPTLPEAWLEAVLIAKGEPIHF